MLGFDLTLIAFLAIAYIVGTVFGYFVALKRGMTMGIELSLDSLIEDGYVRASVNKDGDVVLYKYWENDEK